MKRVCCSALFRALIEHRDGLEWTPVSEGDAAGPIVVGQMEGHVKSQWGRDRPTDDGFVPFLWCPFCDAEI